MYAVIALPQIRFERLKETSMILKAAIFLGLSCTTLVQATDEAKTRSVKARTLELQIPAEGTPRIF